MESSDAVAALAALAHEGRLNIFRLLVRRAPDAVPAGEIARALGLQSSTTSNQLSELERAGLITSRREGRSILYRADLEQAGRLLFYLGSDCCKGRAEVCQPLFARAFDAQEELGGLGMTSAQNDGKFNILFLCTGNSARSIFAEAIIADISKNKFNGYSAGSMPRGEIHPRAAALLENRGFNPSTFRSKSWEEFATLGAPEMDFVITVCDQAANEACPVWPGQPMTSHWGIPDPASVTGNDAEVGLAFADAFRFLFNRISIFVNLPISSLEKLALQKKVDEIGKTKLEDFPQTLPN